MKDLEPPLEERTAAATLRSIKEASELFERSGNWPDWADANWVQQNRDVLEYLGIGF